MTDISDILQISASGMRAQGDRLRVIAENLANSQTTGDGPGADPYRRQLVTFRSVMDKTMGVKLVKADRVIKDNSEFQRRFDPAHPSADANGYVKLPNVRPLIETMDMRDAQRSYEANIAVIENSRQLLTRTIDLLRA